jgi:TrmH family RNA methyltransferase
MEKLTSVDIKWIRSMHDKSGRKETGCFIVEGDKLVKEAVQQDRLELVLIVTCSNVTERPTLNAICSVKHCSPNEMQRISTLKNSTEILAVLRMPKQVSPEFKHRVICLDNIQDPGNLGTIIRIADWFGITSIIASEQTADCYNPKTIQATMGSIFRVSVSYVNLKEVLKDLNIPIYGAVMDGSSIQEIAMEPEGVLVIGNEGKGISEEVLPYLSHCISIPRIGGAESLNAGVACGILIAKWNRL